MEIYKTLEEFNEYEIDERRGQTQILVDVVVVLFSFKGYKCALFYQAAK